jgi:hypothetical protein
MIVVAIAVALRVTRIPTSGASLREPPPASATVTIPSGAGQLSVPRSYFGFSTEYWALPLFERYRARFERVLSLARVQGNGPLSLRIGGDSADHALYDINTSRLPNAVYELTRAWFRQASVLAPRVDAQVILDLNLVADLPQMAARWARAAETQLPRGSIVGYEVGNEPDLYNPWYWSTVFSPILTALHIRLFPAALTASTYDRLYLAYARALAPVAPRVPLMAPVVANAAVDTDWIAGLLASPHPRLGVVSAHMYPYSGCVDRRSPWYPTFARLLSERATAGVAASLRPSVELAQRAGLPLRLTELNSVNCGGVSGISNTFVTALWAPDILFELLHAGVEGVNIHVRAYTVNAAFALTKGGLVARPLLYGLILFARTLGPDSRLVSVALHTQRAAHLKVWAVRVRGGVLHVLFLNKSSRPMRVTLQLPSTGPATLHRLLAPSPAARSGVTLDGQRLGSDDRWDGPLVTGTLKRGVHGYSLSVPAWSAALVVVNGASK